MQVFNRVEILRNAKENYLIRVIFDVKEENFGGEWVTYDQEKKYVVAFGGALIEHVSFTYDMHEAVEYTAYNPAVAIAEGIKQYYTTKSKKVDIQQIYQV